METREFFITYLGCSYFRKFYTIDRARESLNEHSTTIYPCDDHFHIFREMGEVEKEIFSNPELRPAKSRDEILEEMHERGQSKLTCSHGAEHPNPDYLVWMRIQRIPPEDIMKERNHDCDGCCKISNRIG